MKMKQVMTLAAMVLTVASANIAQANPGQKNLNHIVFIEKCDDDGSAFTIDSREVIVPNLTSDGQESEMTYGFKGAFGFKNGTVTLKYHLADSQVLMTTAIVKNAQGKVEASTALQSNPGGGRVYAAGSACASADEAGKIYIGIFQDDE